MLKDNNKKKVNFIKNQIINIINCTLCNNNNNSKEIETEKSIMLYNNFNLNYTFNSESKEKINFIRNLQSTIDIFEINKIRKIWDNNHKEILEKCLSLFGNNLEMIKIFLPYFQDNLLLKKINFYNFGKVNSNQINEINFNKVIKSFRELKLEDSNIIKNDNDHNFNFSIDNFMESENINKVEINKNTYEENELKMSFSNTEDFNNENYDINHQNNSILKDHRIEEEIENIFNEETFPIQKKVSIEDIIKITFDNDDNLDFGTY